jgi:hypothetical protein
LSESGYSVIIEISGIGHSEIAHPFAGGTFPHLCEPGYSVIIEISGIGHSEMRGLSLLAARFLTCLNQDTARF